MMKNVTIDCAGLESAQALHEALKTALAFPDWYGNNLDSLYDCLTALTEQTELVLENFSVLPFPTRGFQRVFADARKDNPNFTFTIL